jgi:hypothetical protein
LFVPPVDTPRSSHAGWAQAWLLALAATLLVGCSERLDWREFRSADGYSVTLPGRAQTVTRDVDFEGRKLPVSMMSTGVGPAMFAVGVATLPAGFTQDAATRERVIAHFRDGVVRNIGGTVTATGPVDLVLAPGSSHQLRAGQRVEARGRAGPDGRIAVLAARFFIVDDRLFQLIALGGEGSIEPQALETFFTSFRLTP